MHQKKLALVNDVTGYGRCSIAVALPIVSALKVQGCILPTAILSSIRASTTIISTTIRTTWRRISRLEEERPDL